MYKLTFLSFFHHALLFKTFWRLLRIVKILSILLNFSGPKRYDFKDGSWIYTHDGVYLHDLLSSEISVALGHEVDFTSLTYGGADGKLS